jgi:hypothetical protein
MKSISDLCAIQMQKARKIIINSILPFPHHVTNVIGICIAKLTHFLIGGQFGRSKAAALESFDFCEDVDGSHVIISVVDEITLEAFSRRVYL